MFSRANLQGSKGSNIRKHKKPSKKWSPGLGLILQGVLACKLHWQVCAALKQESSHILAPRSLDTGYQGESIKFQEFAFGASGWHSSSGSRIVLGRRLQMWAVRSRRVRAGGWAPQTERRPGLCADSTHHRRESVRPAFVPSIFIWYLFCTRAWTKPF